jgi:3'(2'),5'-bisphosphate nucleotidase
VVAEESVSQGRTPELTGKAFYLVDPLDGTKEFLSRNGDFTVNIGLIEDSKPVLGVVYAPALGEIFVGSIGQGARKASVTNGEVDHWEPARVRSVDRNFVKVIASRSHLSAETSEFISRFNCSDFVSAGSSLKFCRVACGEADLYPRLARTMEWDTAAADAVLRAAGGMVATMDGKPLAYGKRRQPKDTDFANPWFVASGAWDPFA